MLLSICIPTYNRGEYLRQTLQSIVSQAAWDDGKSVEITISDNCSTDDTPAIAAEFQQQYGAAIRYVHLEQAVDPHDNFASALDLGQGKFLKLQNDTCLWQPGALGKFLDIAAHFADADLILTPNSGGSDSVVRCGSMDETLAASSFYLTWIGTFAISRKCWGKIDDPILTTERNGGFGGLFREHFQTAALAAGQQHGNATLFLEIHGHNSLR